MSTVKRQRVLVNFIQDRSGSMSTVWEETLSGFKAFVNELRSKKDEVEYLFSLTTFDTVVETPLVADPIENVNTDVLKAHGPRGGTALYDAVGTTIKNTEDNRHGAEKIIVVVVTDGQENSSREWTKAALNSKIDSLLKQGDWTFTYLGTQPETWDDAGAIGISAANTMAYTGTRSAQAYAATASSVNCLSASHFKSTSNLNDFMPDAVAMAAGMRKSADWTVPKKVQPKKTGGRWRK